MDVIIVIKQKTDLYGLKKVNIDQLVYCKEDNYIYHLKDSSLKNKKDGWEKTGANIITTINATNTISGNYLTSQLGDLRYVKLQNDFSSDPSSAPTQDIYGDINIHGSIIADGEITAHLI